jgi:hypothetical protein
VSFEFDDAAFKRAIEGNVRDHLREVQRRLLPIFDQVFNEHDSQPVAEIRPHMREAFCRAGLKPDNEDELTRYCEAISNGQRIQFAVSNDTISW